MAVSLPSAQGDEKYTINIINSKIETLVIGDGNVVNNFCRCLQYPEHSTVSRSGRTATRRTAICHDGGEIRRRTKRRQTKLGFPQQTQRRFKVFLEKCFRRKRWRFLLRSLRTTNFPFRFRGTRLSIWKIDEAISHHLEQTSSFTRQWQFYGLYQRRR